MANLFVGLISGTSVDAIDAALLDLGKSEMQLLQHHSHPIAAEIRSKIEQLSHTGDDEVEQIGVLDRQLGQLFAEATLTLLSTAGCLADDVTAIGSHGQTVRHRPPSGGQTAASFTLQIGDPNTIAENTGITTVADFRRRDIAANGEGAPLAPGFHHAVFRDTQIGRAIVNIGGMANVTVLNNEPVVGFDTGPGNTLMDAWISKHLAQTFDLNGQWAASGSVQKTLLKLLMQHPYLSLPTPKSTGKETFNLKMLSSFAPEDYRPEDVQATLTEFTAASIAQAIPGDIKEVYLCGGGAHNSYLISRMAAQLPGRKLSNTGALGIEPDWVEAAAFAWLASQTLAGLAGNLPSVTGANGPRILGGIYPAGIQPASSGYLLQ